MTNDDRSTAEIERDIERERAELQDTLHEIRDRYSVEAIAKQVGRQLHQIIALAEAYPNLKADEMFRTLHSNLVHDLRRLAPRPDAERIAAGLGALIDGVYLREALPVGFELTGVGSRSGLPQ